MIDPSHVLLQSLGSTDASPRALVTTLRAHLGDLTNKSVVVVVVELPGLASSEARKRAREIVRQAQMARVAVRSAILRGTILAALEPAVGADAVLIVTDLPNPTLDLEHLANMLRGNLFIDESGAFDPAAVIAAGMRFSRIKPAPVRELAAAMGRRQLVQSAMSRNVETAP